MKEYLNEIILRMIFISPLIPKYRNVNLEEFGIQCVEIQQIPEDIKEEKKIIKKINSSNKTIVENLDLENVLERDDKFRIEKFDTKVTRLKLALVNKILKNSLPFIKSKYLEYEILPFRITKPVSTDFDSDLRAKWRKIMFRKLSYIHTFRF